MRTSRKFCEKLAEIFGQSEANVTPTVIEQTRRTLVDAGFIQKSRGRSFAEMTDREALYLLIAVGLPVSHEERIEWIESFHAIPDFADRILDAIVNPDLMAITFYKGGVSLLVNGKRQIVGQEKSGTYRIMLNVNPEVFEQALFEKGE
ncbi:hypothetical protein MUJ65_004254 [Vibrio vulnificus]|nr:hypothetical protein [Vibrio vulnificus]